jgi:hypothetical protein
MEGSFSDVTGRFFLAPDEQNLDAQMQTSPTTDKHNFNDVHMDVHMQTFPDMEEQNFGHIYAKTFHNVPIVDPNAGGLLNPLSMPRSFDQMVFMAHDSGSSASSSSNPPAPTTQPAQASTTGSSLPLLMPALNDVRSSAYQPRTNVDVQGMYFSEPDYGAHPMDLSDFMAMHTASANVDYGRPAFATLGESSRGHQAQGTLGDPIDLREEPGSSGTHDEATATSQPSQMGSLDVVDEDGDVEILDAPDDSVQNTSGGGPHPQGPANPFGGPKPKQIQKRQRKGKGVDRRLVVGAGEVSPGPSPLSQVETVSYSGPVVQPAPLPQAFQAPQAPQPQAAQAPVLQALAPQAAQHQAAEAAQAPQARVPQARAPQPPQPQAPQIPQAPQAPQVPQAPQAPQAPRALRPIRPAQAGQAQTLTMRGPSQNPSLRVAHIPVPEIQGMQRPPTPRTYEGFQAQIPPENDCFMGAPGMDEFDPDAPGYYQP